MARSEGEASQREAADPTQAATLASRHKGCRRVLTTSVSRFVVDHGRVTEEGGRLRTFQRRRMDEPDVDLHLIAEPQGAKSEELAAQALDAIGRLFQQDKLSLTGGLQRALAETHQTLREWNRRSLPRDQVSIGITGAMVKDNLVYLTQAGPGLVYVRRSGVLVRHEPMPGALAALGEGDLTPSLRRFDLDPGDVIIAASKSLETILDDETLAAMLRQPEEAMPELYLLTRDRPNFALVAITCHDSEPEAEALEDDQPHGLDQPPDYLERDLPSRPRREEPSPPRQSSRQPAEPVAPPLAEPTGLPTRPGSRQAPETPEARPDILASTDPPLDISRPVVRLRGEPGPSRNDYARTTGPPGRLNFNFADWRLVQIAGAIVVILLIIAFVPDLLREGRSERLADLVQGAQVQFALAQEQTDPQQRRFLLEETRRLATEALRIDDLNLTATQLLEQSGLLLAEMNAIFDLGPLTSVVTLGSQLTGELSLLDATVHGGRAYLLDAGGGRIVSVPLDGSPLEVIFEAGGQYGEAQAKAPAFFTWQGPDDSGRLLVLDAERKLFEVRPGSSPAQLALRRSGTWSSVAGIAAFNDNLYVLDPDANQVHRYLPAADGYDSEPDVLLTGQVELEAAVGLVVNGDIYVVLSTGGVRRFQNGAETDFVLGGIDIPIEAANDLASVPASAELYIGDSAAKRIVVAGLDGAFRRQLVSNAFTDLRAIAIDDVASQLYIVIGDELLTAPVVR